MPCRLYRVVLLLLLLLLLLLGKDVARLLPLPRVLPDISSSLILHRTHNRRGV